MTKNFPLIFSVWSALFIFAFGLATNTAFSATNLTEAECKKTGAECVPAASSASKCTSENTKGSCTDKPGFICCGGESNTCAFAGYPCVASDKCEERADTKLDAYCSKVKSGDVCCKKQKPLNSNFSPTSSNSVYTLFEQIPGTQGRNMQFPEYIAAIYKFLIWSIVFAAILMVMIGGFWYLTAAGNTSQVGTAKTIISDALLGLVVILFTWIILSVINPDLVSINLKSLSALKVSILSAPTNSTMGGSSTGGRSSGTPSPNIPETQKPPTGNEGDAWGDDSAIRSDLRSGGISFNRENCSKIGAQKCTSVYQLGNNGISKLKDLKGKCGCSVMVTGGTEYWLHSANTQHRPGNSAVDLARDGTLTSYIKANGSYKGLIYSKSAGENRPVYYWNGSTFWDEDNNHWHVNFDKETMSGF